MSPWIADLRFWERPEVSIIGADQKDRGLWGREWRKGPLLSPCDPLGHQPSIVQVYLLGK